MRRWDLRRRGDGVGDGFDDGGELVAAARDGGDEAGAVGEGLAQAEDVLGEVGLFDERAGPDGGEEVLLEDDAAGVGDEVEEDVEGLGSEWDLLAEAAEGSAAGVQLEFVEAIQVADFRGHEPIKKL
jgi:hypothetical protein